MSETVLKENFWPWLDTVFEYLEHPVGEVFEFSEDLRLLTQLQIPIGENFGRGRLWTGHATVLLLVDREAVVADLVAHRLSNTELTEQAIKDLLWDNLLEWVQMLAWHVEFAVEDRWHVEGSDTPVLDCAVCFKGVSTPAAVRFPARP